MLPLLALYPFMFRQYNGPCAGLHSRISDKNASGIPTEPVSAATASQSKEAGRMLAAEECMLLSPEQLKVAAALLVVLRRALKDGSNALDYTSSVLASNSPYTCQFLEQIPDGSELPTLQEMRASASAGLRD